jgi:DNA ligase 1
MSKRELVMLAKTFNPDKDYISGWWASEKLDGQRALWDGGVSRGHPVRNVPWANKGNPSRVSGIATGLWSRYGNVIHAPNSFLNQLPKMILDGELYLDRGCFQETRSIVSRMSPDARWKGIRYHVIDSPPLECVFMSGRIEHPNIRKVLDIDECMDFVSDFTFTTFPHLFHACYEQLHGLLIGADDNVIRLVEQTPLPSFNEDAKDNLFEYLDSIVEKGGEGVMLRNPNSVWTPKRSKTLLKLKPLYHGEGIVQGYTGGLGKYDGMLGALIISTNCIGCANVVFELSGFTDLEREFKEAEHILIARKYGGRTIDAASGINSERFPIGSVVQFRYSGVTVDGIPREARYYRR